MKRVISLVMSLVFILTFCSFVTVSGEETTIEGTFQYESKTLESVASYSFTFSEEDFSNGLAYSGNLTKMSIRMAMAACQATPENIQDLYDQLGFTYTEQSISFPNPAFDYDAGTTTVGYALGKKAMKDGSTLIAVTLRGGGYGAEWGSNFEMGPGTKHAGFEKSANQVTEAIQNYLKDISGDVKFWITGFSRGAAVANVVAHQINELIADETIHATPSDVFAYTFESPRTVISDDPEANVDFNIFNIVNPCDLVTVIPPVEWGYVRYGTDCEIPLPDNDLYEGFHEAEIAAFVKLLKAARPDMSDIDALNMATLRSSTADKQNERVLALVSDLVTIFKSHEDYVANSEKLMCDMLVNAMGEEGSILDILANNPFPGAVSIILKYLDCLETVLYAHYPELEISWVDTLPDNVLGPTVTPPRPVKDVKLGDANEDDTIDMKDVLLIRKVLSGLAAGMNEDNADANEDKSVDMKDVLLIRKYLAELVPNLGAQS